MILDRARRIFFVSVMVAIFYSAHSFIFEQSLFSEKLWQSLSYLGMDISMTPFTSDMMLMVEAKTLRPLYRETLQIKYQLPDGWHLADVKNLDFYQFRLPALLFMEWYSYGTPPQGYIRALCRYFASIHPQVRAFRFELVSSLTSQTVQDTQYGFNRNWYCDN